MIPLEADPVYQRIKRAFVSEMHRIDYGYDPDRSWKTDRQMRRKKANPAHKRHFSRWTQGEIGELKRLVDDGWRVSLIARKFGRTTRAVQKQAARLR